MSHRTRLVQFQELLSPTSLSRQTAQDESTSSSTRTKNSDDNTVTTTMLGTQDGEDRREQTRRQQIVDLCLGGIPDSPAWLRPTAYAALLNLPEPISCMEQYQAFIDEVGTRIAESPQPKLEPGSKLGKQDELLLDIQRDVERTFGGLAWFGGRPCDQDVAGVEDPFWARVDLLEALDAARAQELAGQQSEQSSQEARHMPTLSDRRPVTRRQALLRPLATYATLNPGLSYVQGMNSLIGVLYWIFGHMSITAPSNPDSETSSPAVAEFQAEASAFFALGAILSQLRDLYVLSMDGNGAGTGLGATLVRFTSLLTWLDPTVAASLESRQIEPALYCFRWLTTLFANEFQLPDLVRIWDRIMSLFPDQSLPPEEADAEALSPVLGHLIDLSLAVVLMERPLIVSPYSTFPKIMARLQDPQIDGEQVDRLLSIAWDIRERRLGRTARGARNDTWRSTASKWAAAATTASTAGTIRQRLGLVPSQADRPVSAVTNPAADYELDDTASAVDSESSFSEAQSPGFASRGQRVGLGPVATAASTINGKTLPPPPDRIDGNVTLAELIEAEMPKQDTEDMYGVEDDDQERDTIMARAASSWGGWKASLSKLTSSDAAASLAKATTNLQIKARMQAANLQQSTSQLDAAAAISKTTTNLSIQAQLLRDQLAEQGPEKLARMKDTVAGAGSRLVATTGAERAGSRRPGSPVEEPFTPPRWPSGARSSSPDHSNHAGHSTAMEKSWSGGGPKPLLLGSGSAPGGQRRTSNASDSSKPQWRASPSTSPLLSRASLPSVSPPESSSTTSAIPIGRGAHARTSSRAVPLYSEDVPIQSLRLQARDTSPSENRLRRPIARRVSDQQDNSAHSVEGARGWQLSDVPVQTRPPRIDSAEDRFDYGRAEARPTFAASDSDVVSDAVRNMFSGQNDDLGDRKGETHADETSQLRNRPLSVVPLRQSSLAMQGLPNDSETSFSTQSLSDEPNVAHVEPVIDEDTPLTAIPTEHGVAPQRSKILRRPGAVKKRHSGRQASLAGSIEFGMDGQGGEGQSAGQDSRRSSKRFSSRTMGEGYDADELLAAYEVEERTDA